MGGIARRDVLLSAFSGPLILAQTGGPRRPTETAEFDGSAIQRISDQQNMSATEKEHLIQIDLPAEVKPCQPFQAAFSLPNHPSTGLHHIMWMRVFVERQMVCYVTLAPVLTHPAVTLTLELPRGGRIDALAACNRHATWGMSAPITVASDVPQPPAEAPEK